MQATKEAHKQHTHTHEGQVKCKLWGWLSAVHKVSRGGRGNKSTDLYFSLAFHAGLLAPLGISLDLLLLVLCL